MKFRVAGRNDPLLLAGLTFALLVIFQRSLQYLLSVAGDVERTHGVALVPALLILSVMFVFHLQANRREMRAAAAAAAAEAALATARARELEVLMTFGQSLNRALNADAVYEAIWRHVPGLAQGADFWVLTRHDGEWERLTDRGHTRWKTGDIERIADEVMADTAELTERPEGVEREGFICYGIGPATNLIGVIGLRATPEASHARRAIGTVASLLGITLRNVQLFSEVRESGLKDGLTGCFNRAYGVDALEAEIARARRTDSPLSVLMFDVDGFKRINDEHGHLRGDDVLAAIGHRLRQVLRRSDVRCRYGGDEFLILLPDTPSAGATRVAEWLRGEVEQIAISVPGGTVNATISVGVVTASGDERVDDVIDRADRALYAAKAAGRNCVRAITGPRPVVPPQLAARRPRVVGARM